MAADQRPAPEAGTLRAELAPLFEAAPRFLDRLVAAGPFSSWEALFVAARRTARQMPEPELVELVDAHPRLGAPPRTMSDASRREQGGAPPDERLAQLNEAYEARYGFRYCTFVAGRSRPVLVAELAETLAAKPERAAELARAVEAVVDIAQARHEAMLVDPVREAAAPSDPQPPARGGPV